MFSDEAIKTIREGILKGKPVRGPVDVQILPLNVCNQACLFCPLQAVPKEMKHKHAPRFIEPALMMEWNIFERIVNGLKELGEVERVHFTGGEPLMHPRIMEMVAAFKKKFHRVSVGVVTNGILLAERFDKLVEAGLDRISVSINAANEQTYIKLSPSNRSEDFKLILEGIERVGAYKRDITKKHAPELALTCVLTRYNFNQVADLLEIASLSGADSITFIPLAPFEYEGIFSTGDFAIQKTEFAGFLKDIQKFASKARSKGIWLGYSGNEADMGILKTDSIPCPCYAGFAFCVFWPDGTVRPCCNCEAVMGNIFRQSFAQIWKSEAYQEFRAKALAGKLPTSMRCSCMECGYLYENRFFCR